MLDALRSEIRIMADRYCSEPAHREAMLGALARPGFALHPEARCRAGLLTLHVYRATCGSPSPVAFQAAAAVELQMEAAFMFDHVADQEIDARYGLSAAEELALAIAVLSCGAAAAGEASHRAGRNGSGLPSLLQFHRNYVSACAGQFLDGSLEKRKVASTDEALAMTSLKSGSLGRFAAAFGACMATEDPETVWSFGEFGFDLLTYLQLVDDLRDACPGDGKPGDLILHKKTVPLVFFYDYLAQRYPERGNALDIIDGIMLEQTPESAALEIRREFEASGAGLFGAIAAESFLNRAKGHLERLKPRLANVEHLEQLVGSLEISPQEILAVG